jgi:hypothetical protein
MAEGEEERGSDGKLKRHKPEERFVVDAEMLMVTKSSVPEPPDDSYADRRGSRDRK